MNYKNIFSIYIYMSDVIKKVKSVIKEFESDYYKLQEELKKQKETKNKK